MMKENIKTMKQEIIEGMLEIILGLTLLISFLIFGRIPDSELIGLSKGILIQLYIGIMFSLAGGFALTIRGIFVLGK